MSKQDRNRQFAAGVNDLLTKRPDLAKEWHPIKNGNLSPKDIPVTSKDEVWWLGNCGHEWKQSVSYRYYHNTGCPTCFRESKTSFNEQSIYYFIKQAFPDSLSCYRPEVMKGKELDIYIPQLRLAIEYDGQTFHRNVKKDEEKSHLCLANTIDLIRIREPKCPTLSSDIHCFKVSTPKEDAIVESLTYIEQYIKTHYCMDIVFDKDVEANRQSIYNQMVSSKKERSIATVKPNLAKLWHPTKNGFLKPDMVGFATDKTFWWMGPCGHEWTGKPDYYEDDLVCPFCSGVRVLPGFNDLASVEPELVHEWDYEKNGDLKPTGVTAGSNREVWWKCKNGHEWKRSITSRVTSKSKCPYCTNQKLWVGYNDLYSKYPELAKEWHPVLNGELLPTEIIATSTKKVWWMCEKGHEWEVSPRSRVYSGSACPVCSLSKKKDKEYVSSRPDLLSQWHPTKNNGLDPKKITIGSHTKIWWVCEKGHEWVISPHGRRSGRGCPICAGKIILPGFNDLATKYPAIASQWDYERNGNVKPDTVSPGSKSVKYWWKCEKGHEWQAIVYSRTKLRTGCPICDKENRIKRHHANALDDLS